MNRQEAYRALLYLCLFLLFVFLFSFYGFPEQRLTEMINDRLRGIGDLPASVDKASLAFPWSLRLQGVSITLSGTDVDLGNVDLSPDPGALFTAGKGVKATLRGAAGSGRLAWRRKGEGERLSIGPLEVRLGELGKVFRLPLQLDGTVTVDMLVESGNGPGKGYSGKGSMSSPLVSARGALVEALGVRQLGLTAVNVVYTMEENVLTLGESGFEGDLEASARGTVRVVPVRPGSSRLDLVVTLRPGEETRDRIEPLLAMVGGRPQPDGSYQVRVGGTLERPSVIP